MKIISQLIIVIGVVGLLSGQDVPPAPEAPLGQGGNRMEMMAIWRLTENLKLTPDQAEIYFPAMRENRAVINQLEQEQRAMQKTMLDKAERGEEITDRDLESFIKELKAIEHRKLDIREQHIKDMENTLTNVQRVKLTVFKDQYRHELQKNMREARQNYNRGPWPKNKQKNQKRFW